MVEIVIGLGNVGGRYSGTRHNLGMMVVNRLVEDLHAIPQSVRPTYGLAIAPVPDAGSGTIDLVLALPTTLMNLSGRAVVDMLAELNLKPAQMLVVVDDFNLPLGALRFRAQGSDGGHNGLASIIERLETEDFTRLRLGIDPPADNQDVASFVLSRFGEKELDAVERMVANAAKAVIFAVTHRLEEAMVQFNSNPASPEES